MKELVSTQLQTRKKQIDAIKELLVPIVCIEYQGGFYILDGHARSLRAKQLGLKVIPAIILFPEQEIVLGIIKTVIKMGLSALEDIEIVE